MHAFKLPRLRRERDPNRPTIRERMRATTARILPFTRPHQDATAEGHCHDGNTLGAAAARHDHDGHTFGADPGHRGL